MMRPLFITGTGTEVGKTLVTATLCHQLNCAGHKVAALKPVVSGFLFDDAQSDPAQILCALGREVTVKAIEEITPWRYAAPLSPHLAAPSGDAPFVNEVAVFCRNHEKENTCLLVEGAGGIMTPLNAQETFLDLAHALAYEAVLVSGSYLGAISHTLTALSVMDAAGVRVRAIVISESERGVTVQQTAESIRAFAGEAKRVYTLPRITQTGERWRHAPPLMDICLS